MKTLLIKGNLIADKLIIVNRGGAECYFSDLEQVKSDAIIINLSLDVNGDFVVDNFTLLVTGEIVERRVE